MIYNIKDYGAISDGKTICTKAIQAAIDDCHKNGGGTVLCENGVFLFGTVILRSNVELHLSANATLLGSPRWEDYPERSDLKHVISDNLPRWKNACYLFAEQAENIAVTGMGKIDCNGHNFVTLPQDGKQSGWKY